MYRLEFIQGEKTLRVATSPDSKVLADRSSGFARAYCAQKALNPRRPFDVVIIGHDDFTGYEREVSRTTVLDGAGLLPKRRVVIEVSGGVASCTESPDDIEVIIRDWDNIEGGDPDPLEDEERDEEGLEAAAEKAELHMETHKDHE